MNIKQAVNAMVMNPSINFPWETDVVALVNSFLPPESQLDPANIVASQVAAAIDGLSPDVSEMVYKATLDAAPVLAPNLVTPAVPNAVVVPPHSKDQTIFVLVALFSLGVALMAGTKLIDSSQFVDLIKTIVPLLLNQSPEST